MANVYWFGGSGNWSDHANHWSNNPGNVPASLHGAAPGTDDVAIFDADSGTGTCTINAAANCAGLDMTNSSIMTMAGTSAINIYGNIVLKSGMAWNATGNIYTFGNLTMTSNGVALNAFFAMATSNVIFLDDFITNKSFSVSSGTPDFTTNSVTAYLLGLSMTITGAMTFYNLTRTGQSAHGNTLTVNNITINNNFVCNGASQTYRVRIKSASSTSASTITAANVSITNSNLLWITGAGAGDWDISAGLNGNCGYNSGITFTTGANMYWHLNTGNWTDPGKWFLDTNGGGGAGRVPLPQDMAIFDSNSFDTGSQVVTISTTSDDYFPGFNFNGVTNSPRLDVSSFGIKFCGNMTLGTGVTFGGTNLSIYTSDVNGLVTITSNGGSFAAVSIYVQKGATTSLGAKLGDAISLVTLSVDTNFDANNKNVTLTSTANSLLSNTSLATTLIMGSGTWTIYGSARFDNATLTTDFTNSNIVMATANKLITIKKGLTFNNLTINNGGTVQSSEAATFFTCTNLVCVGSGTFVVWSCNWDVTSFTKGSHDVTFAKQAVAGNYTVNTHGQTFNGVFFRNDNGKYWTLLTDITCVGILTIYEGIFDANDFNVTVAGVANNYSYVHEIKMGNGTWELTGAGTVWSITTNPNITVTPEGSTIKLTNNSASAKTFAGNGKTYNNFWNATQGSGTVTISGSNTFNDFKINAGRSMIMTDSTDQLVTTATWIGSAGSLITLNGSSTGGWKISCTTGTILVDYCDIHYSTAEGGATFDANISRGNVNGGNNAGWDFGVVAPTVTTQAVTDKAPTTGTGNGNITSTGGDTVTRRGFCYKVGTTGDPTVADSVAYDNGSFGTGAYTKAITGLSAGTAYRVRAYAINSAGTSYGATVDYVTISVVSITKSLKYTVKITPTAKTKDIIYRIKTTPSSTKSLKYSIKTQPTAITKSLKYTVAITPSAVAKSLKYAIYLGSANISKDLIYKIKTPASGTTKGLIYSIITVPGAQTKSLSYKILFQTANIQKSLAYHVVNTIAAIQKSLEYAIQTTSNVKIEKSLQYLVTSGVPIIKSLKYVTFSPVSITKTLKYTVTIPGTAVQKTLAYNIGSMLTITKGLIYNITSPASTTKSLKYVVVITPAGIQKSLQYEVTAPTNIQKGLVYKVDAGHGITKHLAYRVTIPMIAITKSIQYAIRQEKQTTKSLKYDIAIVKSITKNLSYRTLTRPKNTKTIKYTIVKPLARTKALKYTVEITPTAITKGQIYRVRDTNSKTKTLLYKVEAGKSITKSLKYVVPSIVSINKQLTYRISNTKVKTKQLVYKVDAGHPVLKSLRYIVVGRHYVSKSLKYVIRVYPYKRQTINPYGKKASPYNQLIHN